MTKMKLVAMKAYADAKHNMTTVQIGAAIDYQKGRVDKAVEELETQNQVLHGYRLALAERTK